MTLTRCSQISYHFIRIWKKSINDISAMHYFPEKEGAADLLWYAKTTEDKDQK
jgi:hypothetical protein